MQGDMATDKEKQGLATTLQELSKHTAQCTKFMGLAEAALNGDIGAGEAELLEMNVAKLKQVGQEAEEVMGD